jgi:hypothetical protein
MPLDEQLGMCHIRAIKNFIIIAIVHRTNRFDKKCDVVDLSI